MNNQIILNEILSYLARLKAEVTISNLNSLNDINSHIEYLLIKILNKIFDCELENANDKLIKNNASVDLIDKNGKYSFQVTSTNSNEKLLETIKKFVDYGFYKKYNKIYIVLVGYDKKEYSRPTYKKISDIIQNRFVFEVKENIIDINNIFERIRLKNDFTFYKLIRDLLKEQFDKFDEEIDNKEVLSKILYDYQENVLIKYRRVNFFGLDVTSKPNEVELESLFVLPTFKRNKNVKSWNTSVYPDFSFILPDGQSIYQNLNKSIMLNDSIYKIENNKSSVFYTDVYKPSYSFLNEFSALQDEKILFGKFYKLVNRTVLLGKPGAGKSSFIKFIITKILKKDFSTFENIDDVSIIPFRLELYKYNLDRKDHGLSITTSITKYICSELLINELNEALLIKIIENLPCLICFDGMDEIFDVHERISVRDDIEVFSKKYPKIKILVTSRFESNSEVHFDESVFSTYEVNGFDKNQIDKYINNWYSVVEKEQVYLNTELITLKSELKKIDSELIENPLLLTLILIIYRNEKELPTSKFEIYKGCTTTIVETRDKKEKKIIYSSNIINKIGVFSSLAHWQFIEEDNNRSVSYDKVKLYIKNFLFNDFQDINKSETATNEFLEYAQLRSIYFENSFTHKTFLEYFTAHYIFSEYFINGGQETVGNIIKSNVLKSSWSIVIELLFCEIDKNVLNTKQIDSLINYVIEGNNIKAVIFFLKIIKYLGNVSPRCISNILRDAFSFCFSDKNYQIYSIECGLIFDALAEIIQLERFNSISNEVFLEFPKHPAGQDAFCLNIFFLENKILSKDFKNKLTRPDLGTLDKDSPYENILFNYFSIFKAKFGTEGDKEYFELLKKFVDNFSYKEACKNYSPLFHKSIFGENKVFNWIQYALFSHGDKNLLVRNYQELRKMGFEKSHFIRSIRNRMPKVVFKASDIEYLIKNTRDSTLRKILVEYKNIEFSSIRVNSSDTRIFNIPRYKR